MVYPAISINRSIFTPSGTGGQNTSPVNETYINDSYNFLTPIDEDRTRYF